MIQNRVTGFVLGESKKPLTLSVETGCFFGKHGLKGRGFFRLFVIF